MLSHAPVPAPPPHPPSQGVPHPLGHPLTSGNAPCPSAAPKNAGTAGQNRRSERVSRVPLLRRGSRLGHPLPGGAPAGTPTHQNNHERKRSMIIIGIDPPSLTMRRPKRRYNESAPGRCVNTNRGLTPTVRRNRTEGSMKPTFLPLPTLTTADRDRFWAKVHADSADGCWIWQAGLDTSGYGRFSVGGRAGGQWGAHRLAWAMLRGEIPDGLEIDHLCQQRMCVNPWHMDPVTTAVNSRRSRSGEVNAARQRAKTHCPQGHAYDEANTYVNRRGARVCRECSRQQSARRYALNPAKYREIARQSRERRSS